MNDRSLAGFWREAGSLQGSITPHILPQVFGYGLFAVAVTLAAWYLESRFQIQLALEVSPYEVAGAILGVLLVMRTNAGYDRWWQARGLWGGIVNQSRNFVITSLSYGPADAEWRRKIVLWTSVFPHVVRCSLRGQRPGPEVAELVGPTDAARIAAAQHMPSFVAARLAELLRQAKETGGMDAFVFLQADRERALLIDHVGGCEKILKTPLPLVFSIQIRRFLLGFFFTLPFALLHKMETDWLIPIIMMLVVYPLIGLEQIGVELQNPFSPSNMSHLPLDEICATIQGNLLAMLEEPAAPAM
jgi:ion channel-forming bestrophin family protein